VIAVGVMSGTSLDGIDTALVRIHPRGARYTIEVVRFATHAFDDGLLTALARALPPSRGSFAEAAELHHRLGEAFGQAACALLNGERADYVASHGQTVFHDGERGITLQLGDAFAMREAVRASVCYDFRSADCAAGGHGAPLVPYVDALLFQSENEDRVALNIGGIANITVLPKGSEEIVAFDTGPGNMLLDALVRARTHGSERFDEGGALAARGRVDEGTLTAMLADPYFALPPPKSTGRERFGEHFLAAHRALEHLSTEDAAATLTELTATTVAHDIAAYGPPRARVIVSGGGASNPALLARLAARLSGSRVERSDAMGISPDAKEAVAFAVLGYETLRGRCANVPRATGARAPVALGSIAPYELSALLARVEAEC
jgi:anhydro-N-acetylmuramic acid kinase